MSSNQLKSRMGDMRKRFFPIYPSEFNKFFPLSIILLGVGFCDTLLRSMKDYFVLKSGGAEMISALKLFGVLPAVIIFAIAYGSISRRVGQEERFNFIIIYLVSFFLIFLMFLYPYREQLMLNQLTEKLHHRLPQLSTLWEAVRIWPLSLFYIHAEMWNTFALTVGTWTFINAITDVSQSKRFYTFLNLNSNIAMIIGGRLWGTIFAGKPIICIIIVIILGVCLIIFYSFFVRQIKHHPEHYQITSVEKKGMKKMSLWKSIRFLFTSEYLMLIAVLLLAYNLSINLIEAVWKDAVRTYSLKAVGKNTIANIYGWHYIGIGSISILLVMLFSKALLKKSWRRVAMLTPAFALFFGGLFFIFMLFGRYLVVIFPSLNEFSILSIGVWLGLITLILIKAFKYTFFDPTKEQLYIPLEEDLKVNGKGAVDGAGARLGKSMGSLLVVFVFVPLFGSISSSKPYMAFTALFVLIAWVLAIGRLSFLFKRKIRKQEKALQQQKNDL